MSRNDIIQPANGGHFWTGSEQRGAWALEPVVKLGGLDVDRDCFLLVLTPTEAKELANRLLKEAAEVEFATKCNEAVQS